jgi:hypothetical protein
VIDVVDVDTDRSRSLRSAPRAGRSVRRSRSGSREQQRPLSRPCTIALPILLALDKTSLIEAAVDHRKPRGGREHKRTAPPVPQPTPHLKHLLGSDEIKCKRQLIWIERTQSSIGDDRNTTNAGGTRSFETLGSSTSAPKDHDIRASR